MNLNFLTSSKDFDSAVVSKENVLPESDEWVKWGGGPCPVSYTTKVEIRYRGEEYGYKNHILSAGLALWSHNKSSSDIVAYRIVRPT